VLCTVVLNLKLAWCGYLRLSSDFNKKAEELIGLKSFGRVCPL